LVAVEELWISVQKSSSVTSASYRFPFRTSAIGINVVLGWDTGPAWGGTGLGLVAGFSALAGSTTQP
jgi:hypothetical protein